MNLTPAVNLLACESFFKVAGLGRDAQISDFFSMEFAILNCLLSIDLQCRVILIRKGQPWPTSSGIPVTLYETIDSNYAETSTCVRLLPYPLLKFLA